jgi:chromate transport protein ChrA
MYIVGVGYFVAGPAGAATGWLAMLTPAFAAVPLARIGIRWLTNERAKQAMDAAVLASAGLIVMSAIPLAQSSMRDSVHYFLAFGAFTVGVKTRVPTALVLAAAGVIGLLSSFLPRL